MTHSIGPLKFWEEKKADNNENLEYQVSVANTVDWVRMIIYNFGGDSVTVLTCFGVPSGVMLDEEHHIRSGIKIAG